MAFCDMESLAGEGPNLLLVQKSWPMPHFSEPMIAFFIFRTIIEE
jgi:hypothetical protein